MSAFTSDLSVDEILLVEEVGFEPIKIVVGASFYQIAWRPPAVKQPQEALGMSQMMLAARYSALARLFDQMRACGADGVVGVRLEVLCDDVHADFVAMGTAVRKRGGDAAKWRDGRGLPFTCNLSGQDFWSLVRGGFRPMAMVHGICCYQLFQMRNARANTEDRLLTDSIYAAREESMDRLQREGEAAGGTGVVGVTVEESMHAWGGAMIELCAIGTAIAPIDDASHARHRESPRPVISVDE